MKALVITPESKSVQTLELDPSDLLPGVRKALGLAALTEGIIPQLVAPGIVLWLHDRGLLMPDAKLWKLEEAIYAGAAVMHGVHPFSAQFMDAPDEETVKEKLSFSPGVRFGGLKEQVRVVQTQNGFFPQLERSPVFEPLPEPEQEEPSLPRVDQPVQLWTVYRAEDGGFRGIKYEISAAGHSVVDDPVEADSLEVLYALMEVDQDLGDTVHPRDARDAPSIVETWRLAPR